MASPALVNYEELMAAFDWVNAGYPGENSAFISRETGAIHWDSRTIELDDALPEDIEDGRLYAAVPHRRDLDLGRNLALRFASERLPESFALVQGLFRGTGAYRRFRDFLESHGQVEAWRGYEKHAVEIALRDWTERQGLQIRPAAEQP